MRRQAGQQSAQRQTAHLGTVVRTLPGWDRGSTGGGGGGTELAGTGAPGTASPLAAATLGGFPLAASRERSLPTPCLGPPPFLRRCWRDGSWTAASRPESDDKCSPVGLARDGVSPEAAVGGSLGVEGAGLLTVQPGTSGAAQTSPSALGRTAGTAGWPGIGRLDQRVARNGPGI